MLGFCGNQTGNLANGCCTVTIKTGPQAISLEKWWSARGTIPKLDKNSVFLPFSLRHSMGNEMIVDARYWWMCPIFVAWHMSFTGLSRHFCWWKYTFLWRNSYSWWHPPVRFSFHFSLLHACLISFSRILLGVLPVPCRGWNCVTRGWRQDRVPCCTRSWPSMPRELAAGRMRLFGWFFIPYPAKNLADFFGDLGEYVSTWRVLETWGCFQDDEWFFT